ncbi:MAG: hypothetical protein JXA54_00070 [Candidatus Heimdallarchaeota archaeon]|nr:hypothetical protein [Candidatus Heimdallarchaeota archaeon]
MYSDEQNQIDQIISDKLKDKTNKFTDEKLIIFERLNVFYKGYIKKDILNVEAWVKELLDEDAQIIGTNAIYPGDFEWRVGHRAAIEMFENDWKHFGELKFYLDQANIVVENSCSWATVFATATRITSNDENRSFEASMSRSLNRIKAITEENKASTLALYQIINDASSVLFQYEQSELFVWPIRTSFCFIKKNDKWLIKQLHFSWPGRGFPVVRITKE